MCRADESRMRREVKRIMTAQNGLTPVTGFSERDYLRFFASKASSEWLDELTNDGGVDLNLNRILDADDLLKPLNTFAFPTEQIQDLDSLLVSFVIGYSLEENEATDVFKVVYIASLYLYCHAMTPDTTGITGLACALIAQHVIQLPLEERLQVARFLLWIYDREEVSGKQRLEYSKASLLLCAYIVSPNRTETLLEKANAMFRVELAAVGPPPDKAAMKATLEEAAKIDPSFDAKLVLEQIGDASPSSEIEIFKRVLHQAKLDATKVAMLNPTHREGVTH
jgi:hypothetical protein